MRLRHHNNLAQIRDLFKSLALSVVACPVPPQKSQLSQRHLNLTRFISHWSMSPKQYVA